MSNSNKINQDGLSIIEIMVAFMVLSVGLIALAGSFPFGVKINKEAENLSAVTYAAQQKLEDVIAMPYSAIATGTIEARHDISAATTSSLYFFDRMTMVQLVDKNLSATSTDVGLKKITVIVYYTNAISRTEKSYSSYTLISRRQ